MVYKIIILGKKLMQKKFFYCVFVEKVKMI